MSSELVLLDAESRLLLRQQQHLRMWSALRDDERRSDREAQIRELQSVLRDLARLSQQLAEQARALRTDAEAIARAGAEAQHILREGSSQHR